MNASAAVTVACSYDHTACVSPEGFLYTFGGNTDGQLGTGDQIDRNLPTQVPQLTTILYVACGWRYTICIDSDKVCWGFGNNEHGQLGIGHRHNVIMPEQAIHLPPIHSVHCGERHTLFLSENSALWGSGKNYGLGFKAKIAGISTPRKVPVPENVVDVSCGSDFSMIVNIVGNVLACGLDSNKLGLRLANTVFEFTKIPSVKRIVSVSCSTYASVLVNNIGVCYCISSYNKNSTQAVRIQQLPKVHKAVANETGVYFIDEWNALWKLNPIRTRQQRHTVEQIAEIVDVQLISIGGHHMIIKHSGMVSVRGKNDRGQLGLDDTLSRYTYEEFPDAELIGRKASRAKSARK